MEKLVLIDGNSLINRAYYAMPLLITKDGTYTNAVYGFMNMFFKMLNDVKPTYVGVAFDLKAPTFRHKMYADYKGTRKPMPEELRPQIPLLKDILKKMNIAIFEKEGFEADDIIGTIAKSTNVETIIYTGDRDSFQLVDDETKVYFTKRGITDIDEMNNSNFEEKTGIKPFQIIELKALMGDVSDNIPGVSGVGEKTALTLLQQYTTVENLYEHLDEISGKLKEKLTLDRENCFFSKKLATIEIHAPIDTDVEKMKVFTPFPSEVKEIFIKLEFKSLMNKEELFVKEGKQQIKTENEKVEKIEIRSENELSTLQLSNSLCIIVSKDKNYIYDINKKTEYNLLTKITLLDDGLSLSTVLNFILKLFVDKNHIVLYNVKETKKFFKTNLDKNIKCDFEDVSIIKYLVDFSTGEETIKDVISEYLNNSEITAYNLYNVYTLLSQKLSEENVEKLYREIELPLSDILFDMEEEGFKIDTESLYNTGKQYQEQLTKLEQEIRDLTNEPELNVNSPKQLGEVLFEKLKIGKGKKTKTGYSTSAEVLEELEGENPVISLILKYRQIAKLLSTYIEGFKPLIDKKTGIIHTCFNQTVTATGRLSSKEPNLQNIPVRDEEGKELRKFFVPKNENGLIIGADYSQIELRLLASFSSSQGLINAFKNGEDVHAITASRVFNVPLSQVDSSMRRKAKAVNFGVIYGISEYGLAKNLKISPKEAKEYITSYFNEYPEIKKYMQDNVEFAKQNGYAITLFGRRRYIRELQSSNFNLRSFGERVAMNMPLQGSAADIIKVAMINVYNRLKKEKLQSKLILQVHDELILDCPFGEREIAKKILKEEMENAVNLAVPLTVEVGEGKTWFQAK